MSRHRDDQSLRRGFTIVELLVGVVTAATIATVSAMVLKAGLMTYNYTTRQNQMLAGGRKALGGEGSARGLVLTSRSSVSVTSLSASSLVVLSTLSVVTTYAVSNENLVGTSSGATVLKAGPMSSLALNYYNLDGAGRIVESTAAASAVLVTALVSLQGQFAGQKTYTLFSGAKLRNHE